MAQKAFGFGKVPSIQHALQEPSFVTSFQSCWSRLDCFHLHFLRAYELMTPIIGITTYGRVEKKVVCEAYDEHFSIPTAYVDAIRRAGGTVVLLPPGEPNIELWLNVLDGIVFTGGTDISPSLYSGNQTHPELAVLDKEREETELSLLRAVLERQDIPTLLICRGMQTLNVALGGTLHEHLADIHPENIHQGTGSFWATHLMSVKENTKLFGIVSKNAIMVKSGNHQGINSVGRDLTVAAIASDGIVGAVEHSDHPFMLGVQWHPEIAAHLEASQQSIFDALVGAAISQKQRPSA